MCVWFLSAYCYSRIMCNCCLWLSLKVFVPHCISIIGEIIRLETVFSRLVIYVYITFSHRVMTGAIVFIEFL
jgi:hypothetical protein